LFYAVEDNNIRWVFSEQEASHLFAPHDRTRSTIHIKIGGTWNEGLTFKAVILPKFNKLNGPLGPFLVHSLPHSEERQIVTPIDFFKLNRFAVAGMARSAEVQANITSRPPELHVYPKRVVKEANADNMPDPMLQQSDPSAKEATERMQLEEQIVDIVTESAAFNIEQIVQNAERFGFSADDARMDPIARELILDGLMTEGPVVNQTSLEEPATVGATMQSCAEGRHRDDEADGELAPAVSNDAETENITTEEDEPGGNGNELADDNEDIVQPKRPQRRAFTWGAAGESQIVEDEDDKDDDEDEDEDSKTHPTSTDDSDAAERAVAIVNKLNPLIAKLPEINVTVGSDGRSIRLSKRVVQIRRRV
jgi:hypothetical protein